MNQHREAWKRKLDPNGRLISGDGVVNKIRNMITDSGLESVLKLQLPDEKQQVNQQKKFNRLSAFLN
jgi:hypothetical protein